jgi:hypothetical protein
MAPRIDITLGGKAVEQSASFETSAFFLQVRKRLGPQYSTDVSINYIVLLSDVG